LHIEILIVELVHIELYTVSFAHWSLHIALCTLSFTHWVLHIVPQACSLGSRNGIGIGCYGIFVMHASCLHHSADPSGSLTCSADALQVMKITNTAAL